MSHLHLTIFEEHEESYYLRFQKARDRFFEPLCSLLTTWNVRAIHLSLLGLLCFLPFVYFLATKPIYSFIFIAVQVILDAIDGCLARHQHRQSQQGALVDIVTDHAFFIGTVLTMIAYRLVDPFWSSLYLLNYVLLILLVMVFRGLQLKLIPVVRSKYYFYLMFAVFAFVQLNYLDVFLVFFSIYMLMTNLYLLYRFKCSLQ